MTDIRQGDTVVVKEDTENLDPRWYERGRVDAGTVARVAGRRGADGVVLTWPDGGRTESAVVSRTAVRHPPRK